MKCIVQIVAILLAIGAVGQTIHLAVTGELMSSAYAGHEGSPGP